MNAGLLDASEQRLVQLPRIGSGSYAPSRQLALCVLCLLWFWPGIIDRGLWKPTETIMVPLAAESFAAGFAPVLQQLGSPHLAEAPLYLYLAHLSGELFSFALDPHEGMRLANLLWLIPALLLIGWHSGGMHGSRAGWRAVLLTLGSFGLLLSASAVNPDLALLTLGAATLAGLQFSADGRGRAGAALLGAAGLLGPWTVGSVAVWYVILLLLLPLSLPRAFPGWRWQHAHILALCVTLLSWSAWWLSLAAQDLESAYLPVLAAPLHPLTLIANLQGILLAAVWITWPALPFAGMAVLRWRHRRTDNPTLTLGLAGLAAGLGALLLAGHARESGAFLLLPAAALMATQTLRDLARGWGKMLDWFAVLVIGFGMIGFFWLAWIAQQLAAPEPVVAWLDSIGLASGAALPAVVLAGLASIAWVALIMRIGRSPERAVLNWMAGLTMAWLVFALLWMRPLDEAKGYEGVAAELRAAAGPAACLQYVDLSVETAALLAHLTDLEIVREGSCPWLLRSEGGAAGQGAWTGGRLGDGPADRFALLRN